VDYVHGWGTFGWGELPWGTSLYERSVSETATVTDIPTHTAIFSAAVAETIQGADRVSALAVFNTTTLDFATVADAVNAAAAFVTAVIESATVADVTKTQFSPSCLVAETITIVEDLLGGADYSVHIVETSTAQDVLTFDGSIYNIQVHEAAVSADDVSARAIFNAEVINAVNALDTDVGRKLWEPIDTGTIEDWQVINTNT
jgi:hypothetical protein